MTDAPFRPFETLLDRDAALKTLRDTLAGADDGELFLERRRSEMVVFDDGRVKTASYDASEGFGLRAVRGETAGYAHSTEISEQSLKRAAETARLAVGDGGGTIADAPQGTNVRLYTDADPISGTAFDVKLDTLREIDAFARALDPRVVQVSASMAASLQEVEILRPEGGSVADVRPMVRLNVSIIVEERGRRESGTAGGGGRVGLTGLMQRDHWESLANEALRIAVVNLSAVPAPAGVMDIALGSGWPGILLHEAVGHGLEGDFNRKDQSAFAGLMGQRIAAPGVTVLDDGTMPDRRGSITVDDEGTPSAKNTLIEDGILVGYMQDRQNARLMGVTPTGNGRRESYAHAPMPRMTNTYMLGGDTAPGRHRGGGEGRHLRRRLRRRAGRHHERQVRLLLHGGLPREGRRRGRSGEGGHADRRRGHRAQGHPRDRQRHGAGPRHGQLRQGRPVGSRRRRPAHAAHRRPHRRRLRRLGPLTKPQPPRAHDGPMTYAIPEDLLPGSFAEGPLPVFDGPPPQEELFARLRLCRSPRVGPVTFRRLLAEHGDAQTALARLPEIARAAGDADYAVADEAAIRREIRAARRHGARLLALGVPGYPERLADVSSAPAVLWAQGDASILARPCVAIVGTRNASSLALRMARALGRDLAAAGVTVVSGLARGVDAAAHDAALVGHTVAVHAGGLDCVYPASNVALAARIAETGCNLSERPFGLAPQARDFPRRNRIVAGVSQMVVVVEAAAKSGSMITARDALDQGRDVLAVPGHPFDGRASGCNMLLRDGAILVRGADDVLDALQSDRAPSRPLGPSTAEAPAPPAGDLSARILALLSPVPVPEDQLLRDLCEGGDVPARRLAAELSEMELAGHVARRAGGGLVRL